MSAPGGAPAADAQPARLGSIRIRLTAWFLLAMAVLVAAGSIATYVIVSDRLHSDARSGALVLARAAAGVEEPDEAALDRLAGPGDRVWLIDRSGRVLAGTVGATETTRGQVAATIARTHSDVTATATGSNGVEAIVARSTAGLESTLRTLRLALIVVGLLGLLVSAALGWVLASRALRPVDRMRREVNEITGTSLGRRLAGGGPDELGLLAAAFNRLLARAEMAAREQESFVADASHELKTPITAIEGHARVVVRAIDRSDLPQARESAEIVHHEARRLAVMLRELLALSEAGSGAPEPAEVRLDLAVLEACSEIRALEPGRVVEQELAPAVVLGEHGRLRELALILIDNAIKYSPADAPVTVAVREHPPRLTVRDRGPGMSTDDSARAFDRFFRGAAAAGRPGSGLGLPIARAVCDRFGATIALEGAPGGGTVATVTFPGSG